MNYKEIKSLLMQIDEPVQRLEFIMDLGNDLPPIPQHGACTDVTGCASRVQICKSGDKFYGTADSAMVRGILAIILIMANDGVENLRQEFNSLNLNLGAARLNGVDGIIKLVGNN